VLGGDFSFRPGKHANLPVKKDIKFEWIPYFGTVFQAKNENTVIATLIMPVKDEGEALDILGSIERKINGEDNLVLSFNRNGEVYSYLFKKQKHGLLLSD